MSLLGGLRWRPQQIGSSLPLAPRLRRWALGLAAVALVALAALWLAVRALGAPSAAPVPPAQAEQAALERLARTELPVWDPGGELPAVEAPEYLPPPSPPVAFEPLPDAAPPSAEVEAALRRLAAAEGVPPPDAVSALDRAASGQPGSWLLSYDAGVAFLRSAGFADRAMRDLLQAERRIERFDDGSGRAGDHAASAATRYALGSARMPSDCLLAIRDFKRAVGSLNRYVAAGGADVIDRKQPFPLAPLDLDSLDVWMALAWGYVDCPAYPEAYEERFRFETSLDFSNEYSNPKDPDIAAGPFPVELARCVETNGRSARCWALSNTNKLWTVNRHLVERVESDPGRVDRHRRDALARLAYDVAFLASTGDLESEGDPDHAVGEILRSAKALARGTSDKALAAAIDRFGRHLATEDHDFTAFAEPYRGRAPEAMPFAADSTPEEVKGMAWALRERWQGHLAAKRPGRIFDEVATVRRRVPDAHLDSLAAWEASARAALGEALADEIRVRKKRDQPALAAGLRDFRADYLGPEWPGRAEAAWWTPGLRTARWGLIALYALFLVALVLVYRQVVVPYVLYTTDFYRAEMEDRFARRRKANLPVTGEEIYRWNRARSGRHEV